ncbi:MAG TPA: dockerin type I repeat-containing protein [Lacipirellulaceae bacterium]
MSTVGNYVYLGDGWVLSARHVGYDKINGIKFETASGPVTYQMAGTRLVNGALTHGPYYLDYGFNGDGEFHQYAVSNPSSVPIEGGGSLALTSHTDLQLFRINGDPGLPPLTIASQPLPSNFTRNTAPEVVMIGGSSGRAAPESHWQVTMHSQNDWTWTPVTSGGNFHGYGIEGPPQRRWGTNRLTDPHPNSFDDPSDPGALDYRNLFIGTVSDSTGVLKLTTGVGPQDIISSFTIFDAQNQQGASPPPFGVGNLETQAIGGDSGAAVFYKRGRQWEFVGIINSIFTFAKQPGGAVYGNATTMANLSYYNQDYLHSIKDIIESHPDYSIIGDVNLDGIVSGDGMGSATVDDVAAFVAGWKYNNGLGRGTITSWKNGDMNRDGKTDVVDFLSLRGALNGQISPTAMAALFGGSAVPEPSALLLAVLACSAASFSTALRRRSRN